MRNISFIFAILFSISAFGTFTPVATAPINYYGLPVLGKGEIITSDGLVNGKQAACGNGQVLIYDSGQDGGFICGAAGGSGGTTIIAGNEVTTGILTTSFSVGVNHTYTGTQGIILTMGPVALGSYFSSNIENFHTPATVGLHTRSVSVQGFMGATFLSGVLWKSAYYVSDGLGVSRVWTTPCGFYRQFVPHASVPVGLTTYNVSFIPSANNSFRINGCRTIVEQL